MNFVRDIAFPQSTRCFNPPPRPCTACRCASCRDRNKDITRTVQRLKVLIQTIQKLVRELDELDGPSRDHVEDLLFDSFDFRHALGPREQSPV